MTRYAFILLWLVLSMPAEDGIEADTDTDRKASKVTTPALHPKSIVFIDWRMNQEGTIPEVRSVQNESYSVNQLRLESTAKLVKLPKTKQELGKDGPSDRVLYFDGKQSKASRCMYNWNSKRPFALTFWVNIEQELKYSQTVFSVFKAWDVIWHKNKIEAHIYHKDEITVLSLPCPVGEWHQVTLSYGTTGAVLFGANGRTKKIQFAPGQSMNVHERPIRVGANAFSSRPINGSLDNVRLVVPWEVKRGNPRSFSKDFGRHL